MNIPKDKTKLETAKKLRREMTPHERKLWYLFLQKYPVKIYKQRIIDKFIVEPLVKQMDASGEDYRMLILPDHPTPIRIRTHSNGPIPYLLYDSTKPLGDFAAYNETVGEQSGIVRKDGYQLIDVLFNN